MRNLVLKNQIVYGTVNAGRDAFEVAFRDLEIFHSRWPDAVKSLITGRDPMISVPGAVGIDPRGDQECDPA